MSMSWMLLPMKTSQQFRVTGESVPSATSETSALHGLTGCCQRKECQMMKNTPTDLGKNVLIVMCSKLSTFTILEDSFEKLPGG